MEALQQHRDYQRVATAIAFLNDNPTASLDECAQHLNLSPEHFQKIFTRWAGVSPKQYTRFLQKEFARQRLLEGAKLFDAAIDGKLSGTARLHDLFISLYGMSPAQYRTQGASLDIYYGFHSTPFGWALLATTQQGICKLAFYDHEQEKSQLFDELLSEWSLASFHEDSELTRSLIEKIFHLQTTQKHTSIKLLVKGSQFQIQVWEALLKIPSSEIISYGDVARAINKTEATRAVSTAIANNRIAFLIPCHRVIRQNGLFNQYRWGAVRKQALLAWEASQVSSEQQQ